MRAYSYDCRCRMMEGGRDWSDVLHWVARFGRARAVLPTVSSRAELGEVTRKCSLIAGTRLNHAHVPVWYAAASRIERV